MTTLKNVIQVVAQVFELPEAELSPDSRFIEDLGATSLDVVTLVWRIEESFGLGEFEESALEAVQTIGQLAELVELRRGDISEVEEITTLAIASDHAGTDLKADLIQWLRAQNVEVRDLGPAEGQAVDYPDFAARVAQQVAAKKAEKGILICGSGIGMSIAANKVQGVRAAVVLNPVQARLGREHNDLNVLCLGQRLIGPDMARECVKAFLDTPFEPGDDGRHQRRVRRIHDLEDGENAL